MPCLLGQKNSIDILVALTPIIISALLLLVTWGQAKTNKEKLRLDLYNRRFEIYSNALDYFQALVLYNSSESLQADMLRLRKNFIKSFEESRFLFDKGSGIYELLKDMHTKSFTRTGFTDSAVELARAGGVKEVAEGFQNSEEVLRWFAESLSTLRDKMAPYLNFHKLSA